MNPNHSGPSAPEVGHGATARESLAAVQDGMPMRRHEKRWFPGSAARMMNLTGV